jgi:hypothetical protein
MEKDNLYNFISLKLSAHKTPIFKEEKQKDWIIYGAEKGDYYNNYPGYLTYLYNRSSKQNAFINGKVHYICGNGVGFDAHGLNIEAKASVNDFLNKPNDNGDTLKDVIKKSVLDKKLYGGFYLELVWNKSGKSFEIYHMAYNSLRKAKNDDGYWYSRDWANKRQDEETTGLKYIDAFTAEGGTGSQIYCAKEYRPDLDYYPLPDYLASCVYAEIDVELSNYRLNAIKSGFNSGTIISFNNGRPTDEERENIEDKLKEKFVGTDQANSLLINFSASKESAPTIARLAPQNVDTQLDSLNDQVTQELIIGHRITNPLLVGIKTPGELGGTNQISESFLLYRSTYIEPNQKEIEKEFNYLLTLKGFANRIYLKEVTPMQEVLPIDEKVKVMTKNEIREMFNLEAIEEVEPVKPVISTTVHRFEEDECCSHSFNAEDIENTIEVFRQYGEDIDKFEFIDKKYLFKFSIDDVFENEVKNYSFDILEGDVKLLYRNIIDLLSKDPLMSNNSIADTLKTPLNRVRVAVDRLIKDGAISLGNEDVPNRVPTKEAIKVIDEQGAKTENLRIMYTYEPRPGQKALLPTSREFCVKLMNAGKIYSRQQIEQISSVVGYDVWAQRGGWWTRKGGEVTTPYCRHVWVQNVVRIKK